MREAALSLPVVIYGKAAGTGAGNNSTTGKMMKSPSEDRPGAVCFEIQEFPSSSVVRYDGKQYPVRTPGIHEILWKLLVMMCRTFLTS